MTTVNFNEKLKHKEKLKYSNIKFWGKQLREQNKEQNKSNGMHNVAQRHANCSGKVFFWLLTQPTTLTPTLLTLPSTTPCEL